MRDSLERVFVPDGHPGAARLVMAAALVLALLLSLASWLGGADDAAPPSSPAADSSAGVPAVPVNRPFDAGEWFHFSIQYGVIRAGDALMQVEETTEIDGRKCYHMVSKAESNNFFSAFYKVRDRVDSFLDREALVSRRFIKKTHEGKHRANVRVDLDHSSGKATYSDGSVVEFPSGSQDILSAFYFVRMLDLKVGQSVFVPCHADKKNYPLEVKVHRSETVSTPAGKFDCIVVEPILKSSGIFRQKGRLTIWLTDDEYKIPVLMKSKVAVGSISAILTSMKISARGGKYVRD
ncbi:MAG: DUF3108 domain-containing protein [Candidatus Eisenbacteria bacterium]